MRLRRILSITLVPLFLFLAGVFPVKTSYAAGSLDLLPDPSIIANTVGAQTFSGPCAAYCLAYAQTIITGTTHQYTEYWKNDKCDWSAGNYTNYDPEYRYIADNAQNKLKVLQKAYDELNARRLPIMYVTLMYNTEGPYEHWVLVVGYKNVTSRDSLTQDNFIVIDPNKPGIKKTLGVQTSGGVKIGWDGKLSIAYSMNPNATVPDPHTHSYGEWSKDGTNHWHECTDPNCTNKAGSMKDNVAHSFGKWTITKEASETKPGSKKRSCSVCGSEQTAEIPAITYTHTNAKVKMKYAVNIKKHLMPPANQSRNAPLAIRFILALI